MAEYTREAAQSKLLDSYKSFYNIMMFEEEQIPLTAICEFFEHTENYVFHRKAQIWAADCEEFIYIFNLSHVTKDDVDKCIKYAWEDGGSRAHIGPGHMYTYITPIFICDTCDEDAKKTLKKCKLSKSFHFSLHGWMDCHLCMLEVSNNTITTNRSGRKVEKILKNVLFQKKRRKFL